MIGKTIYEQMMAMGKTVVWSWGANSYKTFTGDSFKELGAHDGGLMFKVNGRLFKGVVWVTLTPADLYKVTLGKFRAGKMTVIKQFDGIYFDSLLEIIDSNVETPESVTA